MYIKSLPRYLFLYIKQIHLEGGGWQVDFMKCLFEGMYFYVMLLICYLAV